MPKYYGVQRSGEYLAHYGVKGMRWGVRRAKEKGNMRKLDRQYQKAQKKLAKLNDRANIASQTESYKKHAKIAKSSLMSGAALGAMALGGQIGASKVGKQREIVNRLVNGPKKIKLASLKLPETYWGDSFDKLSRSRFARDVGIGGVIGAAGYGGMHAIKAVRAMKRTTPEGHAKAIRERNDWQREMNRAFAGTKYGKKRRRKY